ncbi:MAG: DUF1015 domain-containing protein [Brotaphodocola sp.]
MADIRPFRSIRPNKEVAPQVAALPYDVYDRKEAIEAVAGKPLSFLNIDRAETQFPESTGCYEDKVYKKAKEMLEDWEEKGILIADSTDCYYIYELTMDGREQTGIAACASIDDYQTGVIAKHENTREEKEQDRIRHVDVTGAHTGPIFLAYRSEEELNQIVKQKKQEEPLYDFAADDGISHRVWKIDEPDTIARIQELFAKVPRVYIADGHHRAASAVKVGLKRRAEHPDYTGEEPFNYFLSVLFPDDQLMIMPYNRVVKDLNGLSKEEFLDRVREHFEIEERGTDSFWPKEQHHVAMYLDHAWYELVVKPEYCSADPVKGLDVSILQDQLLSPVLGIGDPRLDDRIQFVGGIRGLGELERQVTAGGAVAFAMYPTSINQLFDVADAGLLMPPKSTWFEPKLRSGLFIHKL